MEEKNINNEFNENKLNTPDVSNTDETTEPTEPTEPDNLNPPTEPEEPDDIDRDKWTYKDIIDFYERVRIALNAVTESTLPDKYMDYPEKAPFAEAYIKERVPNWKELTDERFAIFESIIVYQTAVLCQTIVASRHIRKKSIPTITLQYSDSLDYLIDGMDLSDIVEYLIGKISKEDEDDNEKKFYGFRVTDTNICSKRFNNECYKIQ